jgi:hypothetical protein
MWHVFRGRELCSDLVGKRERMRLCGRKKRGREDNIIVKIKYYVWSWTVFNCLSVGKMAGYFEEVI